MKKLLLLDIQMRLLPLIATLLLVFPTFAQEKAKTPTEPFHASEAVSKPAANRGVENITISLGDGVPPLETTFEKLLQAFHTPGMSIAVVDDYKIVYAKGFGVTFPGGKAPVTPKTLFQAGSISKSVAAVGTMRLVQDGKLSLDEDVNKKLVSWKVPENEFTKEQKVTLRRILSHSAGLTVHGFADCETGDSMATLMQVLNGEKPVTNEPVRVERVPGTQFVYSGGGTTIEQLLDIEVSGKTFPKFMRETVLDKVGMNESTFEQPLPASRAGMASGGIGKDGKPVAGGSCAYPEMAAAGLWTTPTDLAKFGIEMALSKEGKANHVLSEATTKEMLSPQIHPPNGKVGPPIGLGFFLGGEKEPDQFGHDGVNMGFESSLLMWADSGRGVVSMGNSNEFHNIENFAVVAAAHAYGWPAGIRGVTGGDVLVAVEAERGAQAAIDAYKSIKQYKPAEVFWDKQMLIQLAGVLMEKNDTGHAIQALTLAIQDDPKSARAYAALGNIYAKGGQKALALQNLQKAVELNPKDQDSAGMIEKLKDQK